MHGGVRVLLGLGLGACQFAPQSIAGGEDAPAIDADVGDGAIDTAGDAPPPVDAPEICTGFLQSGAGTFVVEAQAQLNTDENDRDPVLSPNGLALYMSSGRPGGLGGQDIWMASRGDDQAAFGTPVHVPDLSSNLGETRVSFSEDWLTVYLGSTRSGGAGGVDVWRGTRGDLGATFGGFVTTPFVNVNTAGDDHDPTVTLDGLHLYLAQVSALGDQEVMVASRPGVSYAFDAPVVVPVINSTSGDADPTVSADELVIMFGSSRSGQSDIWYATRASPTATFSTPVPLPGVNGPDEDGDPMLSGDGCELYFSSARAGGLGSLDIWRARFQP